MSLDQIITEAVASGGLRALTLWKTAAGFQANASTDGKSWRVETDADAVVALRRALPAPSEPPTDKDIFG